MNTGEKMDQRPCLILGAKGLLGRAFAADATKSSNGAVDRTIVCLDRPDFDPTDRWAVQAAIERERPTWVIAGLQFRDADEAERRPNTCRTINVRMTEAIVDACRSAGARLVQFSRDLVFEGGEYDAPINESTPPSPKSVLACSLREAEEVALDLPGSLVIRTGDLFGPAGPEDRACFVDTVVRMARRARRLSVVEGYVHSPTSTADLARAVGHLCRSNEQGLWHIVNRGHATRMEVATAALEAIGSKAEAVSISHVEFGAAAYRFPDYAVLDGARYNAVEGAPEMPDWRSALHAHLAVSDAV